MEIWQLRYFVCLAEHLNFSRAALALHIAQPALSQQIKKLEDEVGGPLFERTKRYVKLTGLGHHLFVESQGIIESMDGLQTRLRETSGIPRGTLKIGSIIPATIGLLPDVLPDYREKYPLVDISVETVGLDEQERAMIERRIDVGILRAPIVDDRIRARPIATDYFCIRLPHKHKLALQKKVSINQLKNETLIALRSDRSGSFGDDVAAMLRQNGVSPQGVIEASDVNAVFALISSGVGIGIASTIVCGMTLANVVYKPLVPRTRVGTMILAYRRDRELVPVIRSFAQHVHDLNLTYAPPE